MMERRTSLTAMASISAPRNAPSKPSGPGAAVRLTATIASKAVARRAERTVVGVATR
jgi:hypothetical protein